MYVGNTICYEDRCILRINRIISEKKALTFSGLRDLNPNVLIINNFLKVLNSALKCRKSTFRILKI